MNFKHLLLTALLTVSSYTFAVTDEVSCRQTIVNSYRSFGVIIQPDSFSNADFNLMGLTAEEFNALDLEIQYLIYQQIKPLEVVAQETINTLNTKITRISGSSVEHLMLDALTKWRNFRDNLRKFCF